MQVAATRKEAPKESQDWDARAAQEVAAALARGANLGALADRKQQRADFLRSKAERTQAQASSKPNDQGLAEAVKAAQAEVPSQLLCAISCGPLVLSRGFYFEYNARRVHSLLGREDSPTARGHVWPLLLELTTQGSHRSLKLSVSSTLSGSTTLAARAERKCQRMDS